MKKTIIFLIIYLAVINSIIPYIVPSKAVYNYRLNFDIVKNRVSDVDAVLELIKQTIKINKINSYVFIVGDSVSYGSPGPAHGSIGYYLNRLSEADNMQVEFFNLSMPSMQTGDIYTILLKLDEYGLSPQNIIINLCYSSFVKRIYGHPVATWYYNDLRRLDYSSYKKVENNLLSELQLADDKISNPILATFFNKLKMLSTKINILRYKNYIHYGITEVYNSILGKNTYREKIQPWYKKLWLKKYMNEDEVQWGLSDNPFVLDASNEDIYFLEKIFEIKKDSNILIYLAALNRQLLSEETSKSGFDENLKRLDEYFLQKDIDYINFDNKIDYELFSDHLHLTPRGYMGIANEIWSKVKTWGLIKGYICY